MSHDEKKHDGTNGSAVNIMDVDSDEGSDEQPLPPTENKAMTNIESTLGHILDEFQTSSNKIREAKMQDDIAEQWRYIAAMYDRVLMVIFMLLIFSITLWFVTATPTSQDQSS